MFFPLARLMDLTAIIMISLSMVFLKYNCNFLIMINIIPMNTLNLTIPIQLDPNTLLFASAIALITASIMRFANMYMKNDPYVSRFALILTLFVLTMFLFIFIPSTFMMLIGWDGLGLVSFILVIHYQNKSSWSAGLITILSNRIGDIAIIMLIATLSIQGHWLINSNSSYILSSMAAMLLVLAAMTKSAQIPFSAWLPAAMAAPTPVSALVHSSTLVAAGVFLLIRNFHFISLHPIIMYFLLITGLATMIMASMAAIKEQDMKKIIALSTLSQLGLMMATIGMYLPSLAFSHLLIHAMFKALMFLCAGTLIHFSMHSQDMRHISNYASLTPITSAALLCATMGLMGTPFISGFYSKDQIMEYMNFSPQLSIVLITMYVSISMTSIYAMRSLIIPTMTPLLLTFNNQMDNMKFMTSSLLSLWLMTILLGSNMFSMTILSNSSLMIPQIMMLIPLSMIFLGIILFILIPSTSTKMSTFIVLMWFLKLTPPNKSLMIMPTAKFFFSFSDKGLIESSINSTSQMIYSSSNKLSIMTTTMISSFIATTLFLSLI